MEAAFLEGSPQPPEGLELAWESKEGFLERGCCSRLDSRETSSASGLLSAAPSAASCAAPHLRRAAPEDRDPGAGADPPGPAASSGPSPRPSPRAPSSVALSGCSADLQASLYFSLGGPLRAGCLQRPRFADRKESRGRRGCQAAKEHPGCLGLCPIQPHCSQRVPPRWPLTLTKTPRGFWLDAGSFFPPNGLSGAAVSPVASWRQAPAAHQPVTPTPSLANE